MILYFLQKDKRFFTMSNDTHYSRQIHIINKDFLDEIKAKTKNQKTITIYWEMKFSESCYFFDNCFFQFINFEGGGTLYFKCEKISIVNKIHLIRKLKLKKINHEEIY